MKDLVEMIAKALVDNPEQVVVTEVEGEQTTVLELRVAPSDLGKVIGKQGRTARCIRTLLGAAGMKLKKRFVLEILEYWIIRTHSLLTSQSPESPGLEGIEAKSWPTCTRTFPTASMRFKRSGWSMPTAGGSA